MAVCKVPPYHVMTMMHMSPQSSSGLQLESPSGEFRIYNPGGSDGTSTLVVRHNGQTHTFTGDGAIEVSLEAGEMTVMTAPQRESPA